MLRREVVGRTSLTNQIVVVLWCDCGWRSDSDVADHVAQQHAEHQARETRVAEENAWF